MNLMLLPVVLGRVASLVEDINLPRACRYESRHLVCDLSVYRRPVVTNVNRERNLVYYVKFYRGKGKRDVSN